MMSLTTQNSTAEHYLPDCFVYEGDVPVKNRPKQNPSDEKFLLSWLDGYHLSSGYGLVSAVYSKFLDAETAMAV